MNRILLPLPLLGAVLVPLANAAAQWVDGELVVDTSLANGQKALVRVDPSNGNCQVLVSGHTRAGWAGAVVYDNFRGALIANVSLPPDPYWLGKLWAIASDGSATAIPGTAGLAVRGLCTGGDGRLFYQLQGGNDEIRWLDANHAVHTLLDAAGTAPFLFAIEHLLWHPATNSLLATTSGWWSTNHCAPASCTIWRIPLTLDGTRVAGAPTCSSFATGSHEVMSLEHLPGGGVLLCLANGSSHPYPKLQRVDPFTLAVSQYAAPQPGDLNGGYYCARIGRAVVLDDGGNVLRTYLPGGSGMGSVLATTLPVSPFTSGYSPAETMWEVDLNGPSCQGTAAAFGAGLAGTGGYLPTLGVVGCPEVGAPFTLSADRLVGGTFGLFALGAGPASVPLLGGTIHVWPITATVFAVGSGAPLTPGAGSAGLPLLVTDPSFLGVSLWFQAGFVDAGAAAGWSLTNGLQVVFG